MTPFAQTLYLWRRDRGLTQAALAQRAGLTRPNLSAIERGRREISLRTLRALALALDLRPGILADGIPPGKGPPRPLPRQALERVADAVVHGSPVNTPQERQLVQLLRELVRHRLAAAQGRRGRLDRRKGAARAAWLAVESSYPPAVVQSLVQRISERTAGR